MRSRSMPSVIGATLLGLLLALPALDARSGDRHTRHLTFAGPVALPGVTLRAGTYIFERAAAGTPDVVVVRSLDRRVVYFMATTQPSFRPASLGRDRTLSFGEARRGAPPPITGWYPVADEMGYAFVY